MLIEILIIFLLILVNGVFSMSELALVSSRKFRLEAKAREGSRGARAALDLLDSSGKFLSTVQVGITLVGILTGVYGGAAISDEVGYYFQQKGWFGEYAWTVAAGLIVVVITYFTLVIGELLPKRIALNNPEGLASFMALPMKALSKIGTVPVWILNGSTEFLIKLFRLKPGPENHITEGEIKAMLEQASDAGAVEKEERDIVERVFFLGDTDVGSLMTPRSELVALDINDDPEENKRLIAGSPHTNFPVYDDKLDNIIGILNLKRYTSAYILKPDVKFRDVLVTPLFVPVKMSALKLLNSMKDAHTHFAIAVDEYGNLQGVVTANDLFKVVMGNLYRNEQEPEIVRRQDGSYLVDGLISLDEFFRYFAIKDTEEIENQGFFTLGGFVLYITRHIPVASEKFKWRNLSFEIVDMDGARVDKILVRVL